MSPLDHGDLRARPGIGDLWRRLVEAVWRVEHAFERARAADRAVDDTRLRIFLVLMLFTLAFGFVAVEAGRRALFSGFGHGANEVATAPAARADLTDRNGELLAVDLPRFGLYVDPREVWDKHEIRRGLLAAVPRLTAERLDRALAAGRREFVVGSLTTVERDRVHDLGLPGVSFEDEAKRVYPGGPEAAHLIGFADPSGKGLSGAERALDGAIRANAPGQGAVALAMDLRVQGALEDELRRGLGEFQAHAAVGLVTDARTGEILAMSSLPDFDPNEPGRADPATLVNHAAASVYEMGSTFKMFTFAMGLDSGAATMQSSFDASQPLKIGSRVIHDFHAVHTRLSMQEIFDRSSNIGTARLAMAAGPERLTRYFRSFGLFDPAPIELAESARPIAPKTWPVDTLASVSFGQAISVTPLNMAAGAGALVNGGIYIPLTIVRRGPGAAQSAGFGRRVISAETSQHMLDLLRDNVVNPEGSGRKADVPGLRVGGKTGSAQKAGVGGYQKNKVVASFAAVFPTDGPLDAKRYLVFILMDEPQATKETFGFRTAGWNSAVVAARVIDRIAPFVGVARTPATPFAPPKPPAAAPLAVDPSGEVN